MRARIVSGASQQGKNQSAESVGPESNADPSQKLFGEVKKIRQRVQALERRLADAIHSQEQVDKGTQMLLGHRYRDLAERGELLSFADVGFRNYSQWEEDGILHYIYSLIGARTKRSVEICAGNGIESNSANLILNHGWYSLLVDGNETRVERGRAFFSRHPSTKFAGPKFLHQWIDRETVNDMVSEAGFTGEVDLFVLDMDGVDYWIWEALTAISPRVVCVEVAAHLGERSITVPYAPDFEQQWIPLDEEARLDGDGGRGGPLYHRALYAGASLPAFTKLARTKGYRLIGATMIGSNAFYMRDDVGTEFFPEVSWQDCINPSYDAELRNRMVAALDKCDWVEV